LCGFYFIQNSAEVTDTCCGKCSRSLLSQIRYSLAKIKDILESDLDNIHTAEKLK